MFSVRMRAAKKEAHISGAEGIYEEKDVQQISDEYIKRALTHPRGRPDEIHITIEKIKQKPKRIPLLAVKTLKSRSASESGEIIFERLSEAGISEKAINNALKILRSKNVMRGAALMTQSGKRVEPDRKRGVRVSRMGIEKQAERKLSQMLSKMKINTATVKEALILASKMASHPSVIAEVCISDDPDYTTGYIASKKSGYLRIPNIKKRGVMHGGRVMFIKENSNIDKIISYLEKKPVLLYLP